MPSVTKESTNLTRMGRSWSSTDVRNSYSDTDEFKPNNNEKGGRSTPGPEFYVRRNRDDERNRSREGSISSMHKRKSLGAAPEAYQDMFYNPYSSTPYESTRTMPNSNISQLGIEEIVLHCFCC